MIGVGFRYTFTADLSSEELNFLDVMSKVIFSKGCFVAKFLAFQRLKFRLYLNMRS